MSRKPLPVYVEIGSSRAFASAADWPGWCRSGRNEEAALAALANYAERYAEVAQRAGIRFSPASAERIEVVERLPGGTTTNFGAPERIHDGERTRVTPARAKREAALLAAAWELFDATAATAPATLRKGPRGGGRDRDKMIEHVLGADAGYARQLGIKHRQPAIGDRDAITALRQDVLAVIGAPSSGEPLTAKGWPVAYAARRMAWHVLDHLWEMRDRST